MPTINDIVSFMQKGMTNNAIVQQLVNVDSISNEKAFMLKSESYFNNQNDIINMDFRAYICNGVTKINDNRSNRRISHNFLRLLINQAVNYIAGNSITYKHEDEEFQTYLDKYLMFDFDDNNVLWLKESRKKGKSYLHVYYDLMGELKYAIIPSEQIIPIYKDEFRKEIEQIVRYYSIVGVDSQGKQVLRKKVEWWNNKEVKIFQEDEKGTFNTIQVLPHWSYSIDTNPDIVEPHSWGKVPFVQLFNNDEAIPDLQDIKGFIDAYDLIESGFINQIADIKEILIKVLGYSGSTVEEISALLKDTGIVKIDSPDGDVDILKTEIPVEARNAALKNLKDSIFMIGQGVDPNPEKIGTNITGIALKMLYAQLDLKCSASIRKMHKALYEFMWFIVEDYNNRFGTNINYRDIKFTFNKNMIMNEAEIIDSLSKSKGIISDETIIEKHPYVDDPTMEEERMSKQQAKELEEFNNQVMKNNNLQEGV